MQDLRLAIRALRATPIVTAVAILSLALGIGANTAIFSLVNSLLLRTLPVVEPQRLVTISSATALNQGSTAAWTYAVWDQIRQRTQMFDGALAWSGGVGSTTRFNLAQGGETQPVEGLFVSGDFFTTLGVTALLGRTFTAADDVRGGGPDGPVAVISYGMWQRRFGGAATVAGTALVVERVPFTVIGVMPPEFFGTEVGRTFDVALPIGAEALIHGKDSAIDRGFYWLWIMLRLKPGQSTDAATATLRGVQPQIREATMPNLPPQFQERYLKEPFMLVQAPAGTSRLRQRYERPLLAILVIVALVLLIACANIANLQLARATARRHELSVRLALGAPRWRLARQFLVESLLLAGIGAVVGLVIALWGSRALVGVLSTSVNRVSLNLSLDWRVMAFTAAVTVATAVIFGTAPALRATRAAPIDALKEHARVASGDVHGNLSSALVVAQVALSLVLIVAAGLFVRTFERLATLPLGFDADRVLTVNVDVTRAPIAPANRILFDHQLVATVAAVPGVASAGGGMVTPVGGGGMIGEVDLPGAPPSTQEAGPVPFWNSRSAMINQVTPRWFATYGTTFSAGRDIDDRDTQNAPPVAVVNDAFARKFFLGRNPIGETVAFVGFEPKPVPKTIVGVVGDTVYVSVRDGVRPTVYLPLAQRNFGAPTTDISIGVRSSAGSPVQLAHSVATALTAVDRNLTFSFRPLSDQVDASLTQERVVAMLSGFFGALALLLAGLGLYGVTSYAVTRRRAEIGIRMALGAEPAGVVRLVLSRVSVLVGLGVIVGIGLSWWASTFVATLLYGVEPRDPVTLVGAAGVLAAVGAFAGWLPAWRASRIDPAAVLRDS